MKVTKAILAVALVATAAFQGAEAKNFCGVECHAGSTFRQKMTKDECHCLRGLQCLHWKAEKFDLTAQTKKPQHYESLTTHNDFGKCNDNMVASFLASPQYFPTADSFKNIKLNLENRGFTASGKVIKARTAEEARIAEEFRIAELARIAEEARLKKEAELDAWLEKDTAARYEELASIKATRPEELQAALAHSHLVLILQNQPSQSTVIRADMGDVDFGFGFHTLAEYNAMSTNVPLQVENEPQELLNLKRPPLSFLASIIDNGEALKAFDVKLNDGEQVLAKFGRHFDYPIEVKNFAVAYDILELRALAKAEAAAIEAQAQLENNAATTIQKAFRKHQQAAAEDEADEE